MLSGQPANQVAAQGTKARPLRQTLPLYAAAKQGAQGKVRLHEHAGGLRRFFAEPADDFRQMFAPQAVTPGDIGCHRAKILVRQNAAVHLRGNEQALRIRRVQALQQGQHLVKICSCVHLISFAAHQKRRRDGKPGFPNDLRVIQIGAGTVNVAPPSWDSA